MENVLNRYFKTIKFLNKIKHTTLNFCKKIGKKIKGNTIKVDKNINFGRLLVRCELDDGRDAEFEINLKDYSVVDYTIQSIKLLHFMK
ncbi:hypothetical protein [Clostridium autoethanogenum]|nr:hypothetical protein [Clostridium autoethanogenum]